MDKQTKPIAAWARTAAIGDVFMYHYDARDRRDTEFAQARKLSDEGKVFLYQQRTSNGWAWLAKRCTPQARAVLDKVSRSIPSPPLSRWAA